MYRPECYMYDGLLEGFELEGRQRAIQDGLTTIFTSVLCILSVCQTLSSGSFYSTVKLQAIPAQTVRSIN